MENVKPRCGGASTDGDEGNRRADILWRRVDIQTDKHIGARQRQQCRAVLAADGFHTAIRITPPAQIFGTIAAFGQGRGQWRALMAGQRIGATSHLAQ